MGITFHFLNYLNNHYKKTIWFSGHTHYSWTYPYNKKGLFWTDTNFLYKTLSSAPSTSYSNNMYNTSTTVYNRDSSNVDTTDPKSAWNIHLPSMSRP
jgi:hypothetical protein